MDVTGRNDSPGSARFGGGHIVEVADPREIAIVVNDAARRYRGVIPADRYHEPYMPLDEVLREMERIRFYGLRAGSELLGVMGKEPVKDVTLIRHAYVLTAHQGKGVGSRLLSFLEQDVATEWLLIGTWKAATWAIDFYRKHGFALMPGKDTLLKRYWDIPERQVETSCVLGKRFPWPQGA